MSYIKGMLKLIDPPCSSIEADQRCAEIDHIHTLHDAENGQHHQFPCAYLPHPHNAWVIGGPEEVQALIADLQAALPHMGK